MRLASVDVCVYGAAPTNFIQIKTSYKSILSNRVCSYLSSKISFLFKKPNPLSVVNYKKHHSNQHT
jgi:hypothetical protein